MNRAPRASAPRRTAISMKTRDWKAIAKASGLNLGANELEAVAQPLQALEEVFRPLVGGLQPDLEPALEYRAEGDQE